MSQERLVVVSIGIHTICAFMKRVTIGDQTDRDDPPYPKSSRPSHGRLRVAYVEHNPWEKGALVANPIRVRVVYLSYSWSLQLLAGPSLLLLPPCSALSQTFMSGEAGMAIRNKNMYINHHTYEYTPEN